MKHLGGVENDDEVPLLGGFFMKFPTVDYNSKLWVSILCNWPRSHRSLWKLLWMKLRFLNSSWDWMFMTKSGQKSAWNLFFFFPQSPFYIKALILASEKQSCTAHQLFSCFSNRFVFIEFRKFAQMCGLTFTIPT